MADKRASRSAQRQQERAREEYLRRTLGSSVARPRILAEYRSDVGWQRSSRGRLDDASAEAMRSQGITLVRVRRRLFSSREIALRRYVG